MSAGEDGVDGVLQEMGRFLFVPDRGRVPPSHVAVRSDEDGAGFVDLSDATSVVIAVLGGVRADDDGAQERQVEPVCRRGPCASAETGEEENMSYPVTSRVKPCGPFR